MKSFASLSVLLVACATDPAIVSHGGSGDPSQPGPSTCDDSLAIVLHDSSPIQISSATGGGGNPQRNYCFVAPAGTTRIEIDLAGGSCDLGCIGDDMHLFVKQGDVPDAFDPDDDTKEFTYTPDPGATGVLMRAATPGAVYIGIIDDANTLGYSGVSMAI